MCLPSSGRRRPAPLAIPDTGSGGRAEPECSVHAQTSRPSSTIPVMLRIELAGVMRVEHQSEISVRFAIRVMNWCGRGDSNPHDIATASPSSWCVCQFRHFRVEGRRVCLRPLFRPRKTRSYERATSPVPVRERPEPVPLVRVPEHRVLMPAAVARGRQQQIPDRAVRECRARSHR